MPSLSARIDAALGSLRDDQRCLEKLTAIVAGFSEGDLDYVPDYLVRILDAPDGRTTLESRLQEWLDDPVSFDAVVRLVRANEQIAVTSAEIATGLCAMLDRLADIAMTDRPFAIAVLVLAVAMTRWEWLDRRRGAIPFDPDVHGPIRLAWRDDT